jgi:uncharacterized protein YndB with AHSA1/START domain
MIDTTKGFTIVREFDADPQELWQAWTDPDETAAWWHPDGLHALRDSVAIDARVGGRYAYTIVNDLTGERHPSGGEYREVVENEKLVFTWGNPDDDPDTAPLVTVTLASLGAGRTRITLDLRGIAAAPGDGSFYDSWDSVLDELDAYLRRHEPA